MDSKELGKIGEDFAEKILRKKGYEIMARNFYAQGGELDIVAYDRREKFYILVEVKTRQDQHFMDTIEAITSQKIKAMHRAAVRFFLQEKNFPELPEYEIHAIILTLKKTENASWFKKFGKFPDFEVEYYDEIS